MFSPTHCKPPFTRAPESSHTIILWQLIYSVPNVASLTTPTSSSPPMTNSLSSAPRTESSTSQLIPPLVASSATPKCPLHRLVHQKSSDRVRVMRSNHQTLEHPLRNKYTIQDDNAHFNWVSLFFIKSSTNPFLSCVHIKLVLELCHRKRTVFCVDGTTRNEIYPNENHDCHNQNDVGFSPLFSENNLVLRFSLYLDTLPLCPHPSSLDDSQIQHKDDEALFHNFRA
ncbi:hypothetical protein RJT34_27181 [Clitoria ternatea]|uniref:Uncharacterized protein n=1 Tax=Clitoria ternatea TaxID=43366 RepID=A0AAN9I8F0_CLITE